jgi:hypothetical protein
LQRFVAHRIGDQRLLRLIDKWLTAGIMEDGQVTQSDVGTPQGSVISVLLSNLYLHHVLDLWFERMVKPRLRGEAYLIRYIDDFVICFQHREDAERVQEVLGKRLNKFALALEPSKTKLIKFGRFANREARARQRRPETFYFLGFTHFCALNRKGNFKVGRKTEKTRLRRSLVRLKELLRTQRHLPLGEQVKQLNQVRNHNVESPEGTGGRAVDYRIDLSMEAIRWRTSIWLPVVVVSLSSTQNHIDSRDDKIDLTTGDFADPLCKLLLIECDDKRNVCDGVLWKTRYARAQNHVPWRAAPLQVARQRDTYCGTDAAGIDGIALNDQHWAPVTRSGPDRLAQIRPPNLTLRDHHSVRLNTRRAASARKASGLPSPMSLTPGSSVP